MYNFIMSQEMARQFAYECFDIIIQDIKATKDQESQLLVQNEIEDYLLSDGRVA